MNDVLFRIFRICIHTYIIVFRFWFLGFGGYFMDTLFGEKRIRKL